VVTVGSSQPAGFIVDPGIAKKWMLINLFGAPGRIEKVLCPGSG